MAKKLKVVSVECWDETCKIEVTLKAGKKAVTVQLRDDRNSTMSQKAFYKKAIKALESRGLDAIAGYDHGDWVSAYLDRSSKGKPSKTFS